MNMALLFSLSVEMVIVLGVVALVLMAVGFLSLFERKFLGISQARKGPNKVFFIGMFQPFSDAIKLITKTNSSPEKSSGLYFFLSPVVFFFISLVVWLVIPISFGSFNFQSGGLFVIFWMSLSVYGLIFSSWFSFSKYSLLGGSRAIAQMISYEIILTFCLLSVMMVYSKTDLHKISQTTSELVNLGFFPIVLVLLFISLLAEGNRIPFDLSESESELVSGYSVEYGSVSYTLLFLGENLALLFSAMMISILFFSNKMILFGFGLSMVLFVWTRCTLPRVRFDKMINLCWVDLIPILMSTMIFNFSIC